MQKKQRTLIDKATKDRIDDAKNDYEAIKRFLSSPPSNQKIRKFIFEHFYKEKVDTKKAQATLLFSKSDNNEQPDDDELKTGLDACDWLKSESLDLIVNSKMNKKAGMLFCSMLLILVGYAYLAFKYPSLGNMQTAAKAVSAFATAILGVFTLNATMRKDALSSLSEDQRESIRASHYYLSKLITKDLVQAASIILLLVTALLVI